MSELKVLDHGFVRLVDHMGGDVDISRAARVSYDNPPREEDAGLIDYLMRNHHTTPFEAVTFTFEVKAPIFVLRQWHRHRTWSYNEVSARYVELPEEFYVPSLEVMTAQSKSNKQMRTDEQLPNAAHLITAIWKSNANSVAIYRALLDDGCPRELARTVLPLGIYSRMFATVDLHNLLHFLRLRLHKHAQWEIRQYAKALLTLIEPVVPLATSSFKASLPEDTEWAYE